MEVNISYIHIENQYPYCKPPTRGEEKKATNRNMGKGYEQTIHIRGSRRGKNPKHMKGVPFPHNQEGAF